MAGPRYTLILGDFYILYPDLPGNGPEPDGDTVNFLPDDEDLVRHLPLFSGVRAERRHLGTYSVRFEGIDALETHYLGRHQELTFARGARDRMLALLGFGQVTFVPHRPNKVATAEHHPVRGYLLANGIESNGRVLAQVYAGDPDLPGLAGAVDGDRVFVDAATLDAGVNAALLREGLAYGELYSTMPLDLIRRVREVVRDARASNAGFWPKEDLTTTERLNLRSLADLETLVIFPKLYRRLVGYFRDGNDGLAGFDAWVRADPVRRDDRVLLPTGEIGNLHDVYDVTADGITLLHLPEQLMFDPDPVAPQL